MNCYFGVGEGVGGIIVVSEALIVVGTALLAGCISSAVHDVNEANKVIIAIE